MFTQLPAVKLISYPHIFHPSYFPYQEKEQKLPQGHGIQSIVHSKMLSPAVSLSACFRLSWLQKVDAASLAPTLSPVPPVSSIPGRWLGEAALGTDGHGAPQPPGWRSALSPCILVRSGKASSIQTRNAVAFLGGSGDGLRNHY